MQLHIDRHDGRPVFRQIVEQVRFLATTGRLAAGEELPSTRVLAAELGLNPMTVSKAYGLLEAEGVVERRPGLALVVRRVSEPSGRKRRREELRAALLPAARAARALGLAPAEAAAEFESLCEETEQDDHG